MSQPQGYLSQFQQIKPEFCISQPELNAWLGRAYGLALSRKDAAELKHLEPYLEQYAVGDELIKQRYVDVSDYTKNDFASNVIYCFQQDSSGAPLDERNKFFNKKVKERAAEAFPANRSEPEHLIHVTCTGYTSPSPLQQLAVERQWECTAITHAYHMGCYASLPAIRMARVFSGENSVVDIFHSELCSLHFSAENFSAEQMIIQSLFADGYSTYQVTSHRPDAPSLRILAIEEMRVPNSLEDMTWAPGNFYFHLGLSKAVPVKFLGCIEKGLRRLFDKAGLAEDQVKSKGIFAVHPGGPKILDQTQKRLGLSDEQILHSRKVLKERGNISSATLPHIWEGINKEGVNSGQLVVSLAFGPGLTFFASVFEVCE